MDPEVNMRRQKLHAQSTRDILFPRSISETLSPRSRAESTLIKEFFNRESSKETRPPLHRKSAADSTSRKNQNRDSVRKNLLKKRMAEYSKVFVEEVTIPDLPDPVKPWEVEPRLLGQIDAAIVSCDEDKMDAARARIRLALFKVVQAQQIIDALQLEQTAERKNNKAAKQREPIFEFKFIKKLSRTIKSIQPACRDATLNVSALFSWLAKTLPDTDENKPRCDKHDEYLL